MIAQLWNDFVLWGAGLSLDAFIAVVMLAGFFLIFLTLALDSWIAKREEEQRPIREATDNRCQRCGHPMVPGAEGYHRRRCVGRLRSQRNYKIGKGEGFHR